MGRVLTSMERLVREQLQDAGPQLPSRLRVSHPWAVLNGLAGLGAVRQLSDGRWEEWPWPWEDAVTKAYRDGERYILEYD